MKNKINWLNIITIITIIMFLVVACSGTKDKLDGTIWKTDSGDNENYYTITFNNPNVIFTETYEGRSVSVSGTYSISNDRLIITLLGEGTFETKLSGNKFTVDSLEGSTFTKQ